MISVAFYTSLIGLGCWIYRSAFNYVEASEMGIPVRFGKAENTVYKNDPKKLEEKPARIFIPYLPAAFKCSLVKYPMGPIDLDYDEIKVLSKEDNYKGKHYGSVKLCVESMAYLNFPREREMLVDEFSDEPVCFIKDLSPDQQRDAYAAQVGDWESYRTIYEGRAVVFEKTHPLIKILRAGISATKAKLEDWSEEAMVSSVRAAAAQITWKEANEDPMAFQNKVEENYLKKDGVLIRAGFRPSGIKLAIKLVDLPQEVDDALSNQEAASHMARSNAIQIGEQILGVVAMKHGMTAEALKKDLKRNPKKAGLPVAEGGYRESFSYAEDQTKRDRAGRDGELRDIRIGNSDGSSMNGELPAFAAAALLLRGGGDSGGGKKDNRRNPGGRREEIKRKKSGAEELADLERMAAEEDDEEDEKK